MPGRRLLGIVAALLSLASAAPRAAIAVRDDEGHSLRLPKAAQRIVSLSPHATELLFAAGAGDRVVGAAEYSDFPPAAKPLPRLGSAASLDLERILLLKPDLAIAWGSGNPRGQVDRLRRLGIPVFISEPRRLEDIAANLRRLGALAGTGATAESAAQAFEQRLAELEARHARQAPVDVFYQIWGPAADDGRRQPHDHPRHHFMRGPQHLCRPAPAGATVGRESVLQADPAVIVASGVDAYRPTWLDGWRHWPRLRAVRDNHLFAIPPDLLQRQTPRIIEGAAALCAALDSARPAQSGK
jgi:iron complex transport system substrate-binding protein